MTSAVRLPSEAEVRAARLAIQGVARRTPLWRLDADIPGATIWLKLENLQPLGSFKIRAAANALAGHSADALRAGVVAPSAGNFGQGLTWVARRQGVGVTIVAPDTAAATKLDALRRLGAEVVVLPFADWWAVMTTRQAPSPGAVFFHPVAETGVVAGNATIGEEILEELPAPATVIVPFGGGGLISGIGSVMRRASPNTRILAVESEAAQPLAAAFAAGAPVAAPYTPSFVDGMGSTRVLDEMWPLIQATVDAPICVSLDEIASAIALLARQHKVIAEGAGAAAVAAALSGRAGAGDIVCVVSGGNIDANFLAALLTTGAVPAKA